LKAAQKSWIALLSIVRICWVRPAKRFPEAAALMNVSVALSAIAAGQQARSADAIESDHGAALRRRADR